MNWQPIETAPRDGTLIDLFIGGEFAGRRPECHWGKPSHCCGEMGQYCDSDWHSEEPRWVDSGLNDYVEDEPTHWMPIPAPPSA